MSDKTNDDKTLSVNTKKTLTMKRPGVEQSTVRQNFSHGRTKAVVVETKSANSRGLMRSRKSRQRPQGLQRRRPLRLRLRHLPLHRLRPRSLHKLHRLRLHLHRPRQQCVRQLLQLRHRSQQHPLLRSRNRTSHSSARRNSVPVASRHSVRAHPTAPAWC